MNFLAAIWDFSRTAYRVSVMYARMLIVLAAGIVLIPVVTIAYCGPKGFNSAPAFIMVPIMVGLILAFAWYAHVVAMVALVRSETARSVAAGIAVAFAVEVILAVIIYFTPTKGHWGACMLLASLTLSMLLLMGTQGGAGWVRRAAWVGFFGILAHLLLLGHSIPNAIREVKDGLEIKSSASSSGLAGLTSSSGETLAYQVGRNSSGSITVLPVTITSVDGDNLVERHSAAGMTAIHKWNRVSNRGALHFEDGSGNVVGPVVDTTIRTEDGITSYTKMSDGQTLIYTSSKSTSEAESLARRLKL